MRWTPVMLLLAGCAPGPSPQPPGAAPIEAPIAQVAIAFDRNGEIGARTAGLADPATGRSVTPDDPVRVASVSKLVVAIGVMTLVEQGKLDLDRDVSEWLGWTLRNPAFLDRPVTLRMLLSHTSSIRDDRDQYVIPLGRTVRGALAGRRSWDSTHPPGAGYFTYSNLNFPVIASVIEQVTGERFDRWIRARVLEPMKIDGCFNWATCSDDAIARAVVLTQAGRAVRDDLGGRRPACPVVPDDRGGCDLGRWRPGENGALFAPQGGLRISARGLARIGRMLLGGGKLDGERILTAQSVVTLLAPQWRYDGGNGNTERGFYCSYGLGAQQIPTRVGGCADDPAGDGVLRIGHAGEAYGLRSGLWVDGANGVGIAYFVTGLPDGPPRGRSAFSASEEAAMAEALAIAGPR